MTIADVLSHRSSRIFHGRRRLLFALGGLAGGLVAARFETAGGAGDPAAGGGGAGGAGGNPTPDPELIPKAEAQRAFKARDAAKAAERRAAALANALAGKLGIDPSELELVETGDDANPFDLKGESLESLVGTLTEAKKAKLEGLKKKGDWESREKELNDAWTRKQQKFAAEKDATTAKEREAANKRIGAMEKFIAEKSVLSPLRTALIEEGAIPEAVDDAVELLDRRIKREVAFDEESGELKVSVTPLAEDGTPLLEPGKQTPATLKHLVSEFLGKKPHLKASKFRSGPGAGGRAPVTHGGAVPKAGDRGWEAAKKIFGDSFVPQK